MGNTETKASTEGYRIIKIAPHSPAQAAGLAEFVDFIICINELTGETTFSNDYGTFYNIIHQNENQVVTLDVYNILTRKIRKIPMIPHKTWEKADSLLGALVRYEDYVTAHEKVLKVESVQPNSPAELMGFEPKNDYILGTSTPLAALNPDSTELTRIEGDGPVEVFVYNKRKNIVWSTVVQPPLTNWEREGYLGCEFATDEENVLPCISTENNNPFGTVELHATSYNKSPDIENGDLNATSKPPTDAEVKRIRSNSTSDAYLTKPQRSMSFELPREIIERRLGKDREKPNFRKRSCIIVVDKPFTESGVSSLSFIQGSKTLENLDEMEELMSPGQAKEEALPTIPLNQTDGASTIDHLDSNRSGKLNGGGNSRSSGSGDDDKLGKKWTSVMEKMKPEEDYSYFSKKKGGEYIIKADDLFNMEALFRSIRE